jgi:hypothetical protein
MKNAIWYKPSNCWLMQGSKAHELFLLERKPDYNKVPGQITLASHMKDVDKKAKEFYSTEKEK